MVNNGVFDYFYYRSFIKIKQINNQNLFNRYFFRNCKTLNVGDFSELTLIDFKAI